MKMQRYLLMIFILYYVSMCCDNTLNSTQKLLTLDYSHLLKVKEEISEKSPIYLPAYNRLCKDAEIALHKNYSSNFQKWHSGFISIHDSIDLSFNNSKVQDAGNNKNEINGFKSIVEEKNHKMELFNDLFQNMTSDIFTLTLAWFFSKDERYAMKASDLICNWFFNSNIFLNDYNGKDDDFKIKCYEAISIFKAKNYIEIIDAVHLLEQSDSWSKRDTKKLKEWFVSYIQWMTESETGLKEKSKNNLYGTWYDVQLACYAHFAGKENIVNDAIENSLNRVGKQFNKKGEQKYELTKQCSYSNSCINLQGYFLLGKVSAKINLDYWNHQNMPQERIQTACNFLFNYFGRLEDWPYIQTSPVELDRMLIVLIESDNVFNISDYNNYLKKLKSNIKSDSKLKFLNYS